MKNNLLAQLQREFRDWYGTVSVEELVTNSDLIKLIKLFAQ